MAIRKPTAAECRRWTGLNSLIVDNIDDLECDGLIEDHINEVEVEVALSLGESLFDGTDWTFRQSQAIRRSWAYRAAASFLLQPYLQKVTGTHAPLVFEDSDAIATAIEVFNGKAEAFEALAQSGVSTDKDAPFAMPAAASSTYSPSTAAPAGFTRNQRLDELAHLPVQSSGLPESVVSSDGTPI